MEKNNKLLMELEGEAKQALDSLKCVVSKFPTVPAKKDCMSRVESIHEAFGEIRRKCVVGHRIAICKWELFDTNAPTDDIIKVLWRTILYHKINIVVFLGIPEYVIELFWKHELRISWTKEWYNFDAIKVAYTLDTTRIEDIKLEAIPCGDTWRVN